MLDNVVSRVAKQRDDVVEACFMLAGFDRSYILSHSYEFRVEQYPERSIFYHNDNPLFELNEYVQLSDTCAELSIQHEVSFR